jgi:hypothetical protein
VENDFRCGQIRSFTAVGTRDRYSLMSRKFATLLGQVIAASLSEANFFARHCLDRNGIGQ